MPILLRIYLHVEHFALVHWPEEQSTTVLKLSSILEPPLLRITVGDACTVKFGIQKCDGCIAGIGKLSAVKQSKAW